MIHQQRNGTKPVSVLFLHHGRDWIRGSERCLLELASGLDQQEFYPVIASDAPTVIRVASERGIETVAVHDWGQNSRGLLPPRQLVHLVKQQVERFSVKVIHANNPVPIKAALSAARGFRIPLLAHIHLTTTLEERLHTGLHQASAIVGVGSSALSGLREDGYPEDRLYVIHNGVDENRLESGDARHLRFELGLEKDELVLTAVTSLIELKGIDTLLRSMQILRNSGERCVLLIVGGGPFEQQYRELASRLSVTDRVIFLGERTDVGAILRHSSDVLVSASRMEAFPLNVLEAAYCFLPVIASDIPAHREAVADGETGILFDAASPESLANAVRRLKEEPKLAQKLGANGGARVRSGYLLRHYIEKFSMLYRHLIAIPSSNYGWRHGTLWPPVYSKWVGKALARRVTKQ